MKSKHASRNVATGSHYIKIIKKKEIIIIKRNINFKENKKRIARIINVSKHTDRHAVYLLAIHEIHLAEC